MVTTVAGPEASPEGKVLFCSMLLTGLPEKLNLLNLKQTNEQH